MFSQAYYLIRSRTDGNYLSAHPHRDESADTAHATPRYLMLFREHFEALSYLNTHAPSLADRFAVESISGSQIDGVLKRWGFAGIGIVQDPLVPQVDFLLRQ